MHYFPAPLVSVRLPPPILVSDYPNCVYTLPLVPIRSHTPTDTKNSQPAKCTVLGARF